MNRLRSECLARGGRRSWGAAAGQTSKRKRDDEAMSHGRKVIEPTRPRLQRPAELTKSKGRTLFPNRATYPNFSPAPSEKSE